MDRLRVIGLVEGCSFLLLLGVAMPLKYFAAMPVAVQYVGWLHGVLFMAYCLALLQAWIERQWSLVTAGGLFVAAVVPFGPFVADRKLRRVGPPA